jgi:hypothetical protein
MTVAATIAETESALDIFIDVNSNIQYAHAFFKRIRIGFVMGAIIDFRIIT